MLVRMKHASAETFLKELANCRAIESWNEFLVPRKRAQTEQQYNNSSITGGVQKFQPHLIISSS
jgi:hypothetical protein